MYCIALPFDCLLLIVVILFNHVICKHENHIYKLLKTFMSVKVSSNVRLTHEETGSKCMDLWSYYFKLAWTNRWRKMRFLATRNAMAIVWLKCHCKDVIMNAMASQITGVSIVYSSVGPGADQRKHQSSASLAFVRGIHRWPVDSTYKRPVTRKMFQFDGVIM